LGTILTLEKSRGAIHAGFLLHSSYGGQAKSGPEHHFL